MYSLNQQAVKIQIKVKDCVSDSTFDMSDVTSQKIIFYRSDGTSVEKTATLIADTENAGEFFVQYIITGADTVLNLRGLLQYTAILTLNGGSIAQLSQRRNAWVV